MFVFLFTLFLLTRLIFLTHLPIFNDEAIYLHWGLDFMRNFGRGVTPVTIGGKQLGVPLLFGLVQLLPFDPLLLGRFLSVIFSLVTYLASIAIFRKLFPNRPSAFLSLLLIFSPFLLFFDRMALIDSIVVAVYSASLFLVLNILERPTLGRSFLLGTLLAFGWWMKSTILLAFPTIFLIFAFEIFQNRKRIKALSISYATILLTFFLFILPVLFHPNYWKLPLQETERLLTFSEILSIPISFWLVNFQQILTYFFIYATPLVFFAFSFGIFSFGKSFWQVPTLHRDASRIRTIFLWFFVPTLIELFFFRRIDSRYIVLTVPSFLLIVAYMLDSGLPAEASAKGENQRIKLYQFLTGGTAAFFSLLLIFSPLSFYSLFRVFPVIQDDLSQYVSGWPSGYGVKEAVEYVKEKSAGKPTFVFVRNDSGNPEDAVYVYLSKEKNIRVLPTFYLEFIRGEKEALITSGTLFYFISRGPQYAGLESRLTELTRFKKPLDDEFVGVYKLKI